MSVTSAAGPFFALFSRPVEGPPAAAELTVTPLWPALGGGVGAAPPSAAAAPAPTRAALRAAPRAYLLLGEQTTLHGVGHLVRAAFFPDAITTPEAIRAADDSTLGAAVLRIGLETTFGAAPALAIDGIDRRWRVGTLLPLPVWAVDTGTTRSWRVAADQVAAVVGAVPLPPQAPPLRWLGGEPTRVLDGSDSPTDAASGGGARVEGAVTRRRALEARVAAAVFDPGAEGARLAVESLWNPYDVLFELLELTTVLAARPAAERAAFAAGYWGALTVPERAVLNLTSAGHAWLRWLWRWWGRGASVASLRTTLALVDDDLTARSPGAPGDLEPGMPGVVGLPECSPKTQGVALPIMAFGRRVRFLGAQYPIKNPTFFGISHPGTVPPARYLRRRPVPITVPDTHVLPGTTAAQRAETDEQYARILSALSHTEGNLDAAASWDRAVCSLGFQQWSMHVPTEATALLERLKRIGPAYHDVVLGSLGVDTGTVAAGAPSADGSAIADLGESRCFYTLSPALPPVSHVPDDAGPGTRSVRRAVFDWVELPVTPKVSNWRLGRRAALHAARWVVTARFALEVWQAEADLATERIMQTARRLRSAREVTAWTPVLQLSTAPKGTAAAPVTALELFGTEALLGLVVDMIVNTPEHASSAMRRAVLRVLAAAHDPANPAVPVTLDDELRVRLVLAFLAERHYFGWADKSKVVHTTRGGAIDVAPARVKVLLQGLGDAGDLHASTLPGDLAAALRSARIPNDEQLSWTRPVRWPGP